jgi:predicted metal-binding protein
MAKHTLFVCKSCAFSKSDQRHNGERGGVHLLNQLDDLYFQWQLNSEFIIQAVDCLSACNRFCAIVLAAPDKTTLMFGDLPPLQSADAILKLSEQYFASSDGIVPRQERPEALRKGILARIPPLSDRA